MKRQNQNRHSKKKQKHGGEKSEATELRTACKRCMKDMRGEQGWMDG